MVDSRSRKVAPHPGALIFTAYGAAALGALLVFSWAEGSSGLAALTGAALLLWGATYAWSSLSLVGVDAKESLSHTVAFPGEAVTVHLTLDNRKLWPLAWLKLTHPTLPHIVTEGAWDFDVGWVPGFGQVQDAFGILPTRRGRHRLGPRVISSGDPFGLFERTRTLPDAPELLVYPALLDMALVLPSWPEPLGDKQERDFLFGDPLAIAGIRDYSPGDPLRLVNWVATARLQRLQSNIVEGSVAPRIILLLGEAVKDPETAPEGSDPFAFELLVAAAASLAVDLGRRRVEVGIITTFRTDGSDLPTYVPPAPGLSRHVTDLLTHLALLTSGRATALAPFLRETRLPQHIRFIRLSAVHTKSGLEAWQALLPGHPITSLALDTQDDPDVLALLPGWRNDDALVEKVLGPTARGQ